MAWRNRLDFSIRYLNIHESNQTRLQSAIASNRDVSVGEREIKKGANVNYHNKNVDTPLHFACRKGAVEWVCMLLYHGADPNVTSKGKILPIAQISSKIPETDREFLVDILFPYTFDSGSSCVSLRILAAAMMEESSLFCRIVSNVTLVDYDSEDVKFLFRAFHHVKAKHFRVFIEKFEDVTKDLVENDLLNKILEKVRIMNDYQIRQMKEIYHIILHSNVVGVIHSVDSLVNINFIDGIKVYCERSHIITQYIKAFGRSIYSSEDEITKMVLLMVSYGLPITLLDLDTVYKRYNYCELFRILLHMDIEHEASCNVSPIVSLYYYPKLDIEDCIKDAYSRPFLLDFYNNFELKELLWSLSNHRYYEIEAAVLAKLTNMPQLPSLVELSRNVARRYIARKFDAKNSKQFYVILGRLPIDRVTKTIITLERKLY